MSTPSSIPAAPLPLAGRRIGFYTSVVGMGGSEVVFADAMEAAHRAGAELVCWSESGAAIRQIVASRADRLRVTHRAWPAAAAAAGPTEPAARAAPALRPRIKPLAVMWHRLVPVSVRRWAGFCQSARAFRAELRRVPVDLLFVNVNGSEAVSLAGGDGRVPVVNCYHLSFTRSSGGRLARFGDWAARRATMRAGALAVHVSAAARDQWSGQFGYPTDRTRVIYNGVEPTAVPDRAATRAALGVPEGAFVFCAPGRLDDNKGHRYLLQALQTNKEQFSNSCVLICGDGSLRPALEHFVSQSGLGGIVRFLGWRNDLPEILHAADCTVLSSVSSENLSVAVLESLMVGTPAVVTRVGGMAEAVREGETGYVVPPRDSAALAAAMLRLCSKQDLAREMRAAARRDAQVRFTRERMMAEYVAVFAEVLGGRNRTRE
ncbi:glycosyltransferase [Frigoriglobus tundricola]|uniref:glycosyltransferase n=1 Tax=Frigoriglobus tundricola TaxID=2774151 RepID=UPI00148EE806|nr:glycosyltransferase [Frigoriglobus tundricola]